MKPMTNTLLTVSKIIAIGVLFSNGYRDRDRDLKFDQDLDLDCNCNFRVPGHALAVSYLLC